MLLAITVFVPPQYVILYVIYQINVKHHNILYSIELY